MRSLGISSGTHRHCGCFVVWAYELHRVSSTESLGETFYTGKTSSSIVPSNRSRQAEQIIATSAEGIPPQMVV